MKKITALSAIALCIAVSCSKNEPQEEKHDILKAPTGLNAPEEELGSFSFIVKWDAVDSKDVASYIVSYKDETASEWKEKSSYALKAEISELEMKHSYNVRVRALSSAGEQYNSPWSSEIKVTTIQAIDVKIPTGLKSTATASSSISLEWDAMENAKGYVVKCKAEGSEAVMRETSENKATVEGLSSGTKYSVSVKTCSRSGESYDSEYCEPISVETVGKSYGICCAADFKEFLKEIEMDHTGGAYKAEDGMVHLRSDLDLGEITSIDTTSVFSGIFDGEGHKISNLKISSTYVAALFPVVDGGTIKNLTIDETCSFTITLSENEDETCAGSIAGIVKGGSCFENLVNKAAVNGGSSSGGIASSFWTKDGVVRFTNCENYGPVYVSAERDVKRNVFIGGICGASEGAGAENFSTEFYSCKNHGVLSDLTNNSANTYHNVSGITALGSDCYFEGCTNDGTLTLKVNTANKIWVGGICGRSYRSSYKDCSNSGQFDFTAPVNGNRELYAGGVVGWSGSTPKTPQMMSGCKNTADINIVCAADMTKAALVAGVIAYSEQMGFVCKDCTNSGNISATMFAGNSSVAGVVGWFKCATSASAFGEETSKIVNCVNTGNVSYDTDDDAITSPQWIQLAGVVGEVKTAFTTVENCRNDGNISVDRKTRSNAGGVVCESNGSISGCTNNGSVTIGSKHNDYYSNAGGVVARMVGANQTVQNSINNGTITYLGQGLSKENLSEGYIGQGGVVAFLQKGDVLYCENNGLILGGESTTYNPAYGSIAAWIGIGALSHVKGCRVGGAVGIADIEAADFGASKATVLTEDNFQNYIIGKKGSKYESTIEDCVFNTK